MWHLSKFQQNYNIGPTQRHSTTLHLSNNSIIYMVHPKEHTLATPIISLFTFRLLENNLLKIFLLTLSKSFQRQKINKRFGWKLSFRYCNLYKALRDYNRIWISFFFFFLVVVVVAVFIENIKKWFWNVFCYFEVSKPGL